MFLVRRQIFLRGQRSVSRMNYLFPPKLELNYRAARIYSPELSGVQPSSKYDHEQLPSNIYSHINRSSIVLPDWFRIADWIGLDWIGLDWIQH